MLKDKLNFKKSIGVALALVFIFTSTLLTTTKVKGMNEETGKMEPLNQRAYIAVECIDEETGEDIVPIKSFGTPLGVSYEDEDKTGYGEFIIYTKDFKINGYSLDLEQAYGNLYDNCYYKLPILSGQLNIPVDSGNTIANPSKIFLMYTKKGHHKVPMPPLP
ncbi:hypothetical protein [Clostridium tyrobutyricum]|jgi:hypothetical protein|uniref:hypothetical protein n=1 Tax=Clostridium tyrobutyricum TaxID=1519 RepID=UPI0018A8BBD6|nr:hypothetical protein [Clostridium tyrobutyricum]